MAKRRRGSGPRPQFRDKGEAAETDAAARDGSGLRAFFADNRNLYLALGLGAVCILLYGQTIGFDFVGIDDSGYVARNAVVANGLSWAGIKWAFTTFEQTNWHPLTWLSYLLDATFFGVKPGPYHLVNAILHALNSVFLFVVIKQLTGSTWRSAAVAALFAVHPAHVESVAWISERKDVLSTFFWIAATYFYIRYARTKNAEVNDEASGPSLRFYALTAVAMALGILAKPMVVTLPFTLLLLDYWPLGRLEELSLKRVAALVAEKIPLFLISIASSVVTVIAQRSGGAVVSLEQIPFHLRALNALVSYAKYVGMMFYPLDLGIFYPYQAAIPVWQIAVAGILLAAITVYCVVNFRRRKFLLVGWLWFLGTMVPVIGLVQVGTQNMADRYTYVPFIGLGIMIVWSVRELTQRLDPRIFRVAAAIVLLLFAVLAFRQIRFWRNSETLFVQTLAVTTNNGLIEQNLCLTYLGQNRLGEAAVQCRNSIRHQPGYYNGYKLLGVIAFRQKNFDEAAKNFEVAVRMRPDDRNAFSGLIQSLASLGRLEEAAELAGKMDAGAQGDPTLNEDIYQTAKLLGIGYAQRNDYAKAGDYYRKAAAVKPDDADLRANLGAMLFRAGQREEGLAQVRQAITQDPNQADPYNLYGELLLDAGRVDEAIGQFQKALQLNPGLTTAKSNLQRAQSRK